MIWLSTGERCCSDQLGDIAQVHELGRDGEGKADLVHSAAAGPAGHLVKLGRRQGQKLGAVEAVGIQKSHRAGRKIDARSDCRGGENSIQKPLQHQGFHQDFPERQLGRCDVRPPPGAPSAHIWRWPARCGHWATSAAILRLRRSWRSGLRFWVLPAEIHGVVAVGSRFQEKNRRQQAKLAQNPQHVAKGRQFAGRRELGWVLAADERPHLLVQHVFFGRSGGHQQRVERPRRMQQQRGKAAPAAGFRSPPDRAWPGWRSASRQSGPHCRWWPTAAAAGCAPAGKSSPPPRRPRGQGHRGSGPRPAPRNRWPDPRHGAWRRRVGCAGFRWSRRSLRPRGFPCGHRSECRPVRGRKFP